MTAIEAGVLAAKARPTEPRGQGRQGRKRAGRPARRSASRRSTSDSLLSQLVARRSFREPFVRTLTADVVANLIRNVWSYAIIFCGHFPDQTYTFTQEETDDESRGGWYVRQLLGAANIDGGPLFHVISGNLGYQVEHHLYPDMPSTRYGEIAPKVREICERYDLPYNTGPVPPAARHGAAHDHPAGLPGRASRGPSPVPTTARGSAARASTRPSCRSTQ